MHDRIVVIPRFSSNARWLSEHVGIGEAAERAKLDVYWNGPSDEADVQEQTELAERPSTEAPTALSWSPALSSR
jgi:hypothetical protein